MLLLLNALQFGFELSGVIVPKNPPCFGIPYFERLWWDGIHGKPGRIVYIQDISDGELSSFVSVDLNDSVKTIDGEYIKSLCLEGGEYLFPKSKNLSHNDPPTFLKSSGRLYAYAESFESVFVGYKDPMRRRLSRKKSDANESFPNVAWIDDWKTENSNESYCFGSLEVARFRQDRSACLSALRECFETLQVHNRSLAVHWLNMTKDYLKKEGVLESSD